MELKDINLNVFPLFDEKWGLVTAGNLEHFNTCTVAWGELGQLWRRPVATVYINPLRYTNEFMQANDTFTLSFFPDAYHKDLALLGSKSGRDGNKVAETLLTPISFGDSVGYEEANLIFLCKKIYTHLFETEKMDTSVQSIYSETFPPHYMYIGEIIDVIKK